MRAGALIAAAVLAVCGGAAAVAQDDAPSIATVAVSLHGLDSSLAEAGGELALAIGERLVVCVTPSDDGFISVWTKDAASPQVTRIFPNAYAGADRTGVPVVGGEETCIGEAGDSFVLRVSEPAGISEITVAWTAREDQQLTPEMFENPAARTGVMAIGTSRFAIVE